jgi:hypothetical protein
MTPDGYVCSKISPGSFAYKIRRITIKLQMYKQVFAYSSVDIIVLINSIVRGFRVSIKEMLTETSNPISDTIIKTHIISATKLNR